MIEYKINKLAMFVQGKVIGLLNEKKKTKKQISADLVFKD